MYFQSPGTYPTYLIADDQIEVTRGYPLFRISKNISTTPSIVPLFMNTANSIQVAKGMKALVTPYGYKRSDVGGIKAKVENVASEPSRLEDIINIVGNKSQAELILRQIPSPTLILLQLETNNLNKGKNRGGYLWSSKGDLPFPPKTTDLLNAQITTRYVTPISLVLPSFKRLVGITPPEKKYRNFDM